MKFLNGCLQYVLREIQPVIFLFKIFSYSSFAFFCDWLKSDKSNIFFFVHRLQHLIQPHIWQHPNCGICVPFMGHTQFAFHKLCPPSNLHLWCPPSRIHSSSTCKSFPPLGCHPRSSYPGKSWARPRSMWCCHPLNDDLQNIKCQYTTLILCSILISHAYPTRTLSSNKQRKRNTGR